MILFAITKLVSSTHITRNHVNLHAFVARKRVEIHCFTLREYM